MLVAQSCLTLCDPMDCSVRGILQARTLEWVAFPFSRGSSQPRSLALQVDSLPAEPQGKLDCDLTGLSSRGSLSCVPYMGFWEKSFPVFQALEITSIPSLVPPCSVCRIDRVAPSPLPLPPSPVSVAACLTDSPAFPLPLEAPL